MRLFLTSIAFLSRIPVPMSWQVSREADFLKLPRWFWLAGLLLGSLNALVALGLEPVLPVPMVAAILASAQILISGAFHEDGFSDVADAMGGYTRERKFEIMRDSRLGTFGVAALGTVLLLRVAGYLHLGSLPSWSLPVFLALVGGWSRWASVLILQILPYSHPRGKGIGKGLSPTGWPIIIMSGIVMAVLTWLWSPLWLAATALSLTLSIVIAALFFRKVFGAVNGDCLGATCIFSELSILIGTVAVTF